MRLLSVSSGGHVKPPAGYSEHLLHLCFARKPAGSPRALKSLDWSRHASSLTVPRRDSPGEGRERAASSMIRDVVRTRTSELIK